MEPSNNTYICVICGGSDWSPVFSGLIRDGSFGNMTRDEHTVYQCNGCAVQRLEEPACKDDSFYAGKKYRELLGEAADAEGFWEKHDIHQIRNLNVIWPHSIRNRVVADIGCAAGSFLDHISGLARTCLAVEPCEEYHDSLKRRGFKVYHSNAGVLEDFAGQVDFAFSFSTVEHIENPFEFFSEIYQLLRPDCRFLVSTPNRNDILMELLGDEYKQFFYRTVHRWYFDMDSLINLARLCGFKIVQEKCLQRFGISNTVAWLRDRKPTGDQPLPGIDDPLLNKFWKIYLESKGAGDYLYLLLKRGDK
jgi:2-polyprenyl-3-methyl-5-hydroxy-6-metoxy-1,4-benzoquinol methylase